MWSAAHAASRKAWGMMCWTPDDHWRACGQRARNPISHARSALWPLVLCACEVWRAYWCAPGSACHPCPTPSLAHARRVQVGAAFFCIVLAEKPPSLTAWLDDTRIEGRRQACHPFVSRSYSEHDISCLSLCHASRILGASPTVSHAWGGLCGELSGRDALATRRGLGSAGYGVRALGWPRGGVPVGALGGGGRSR